MGLLTTTKNKELEEARTQIQPAERVCPSCKQPFTTSGETLSAYNRTLGIEGHTCPHCGGTLSFSRRPLPGGF